MAIQNWALFTAESGDELTRGWQGYESQARKMAQEYATRIGRAVELIAEDDISAHDSESDDEPPSGEVFDPEGAQNAP